MRNKPGVYGDCDVLSLYEGRCWFIFHNFRNSDGVCEHRLGDPSSWGWKIDDELTGEDFNLPLELFL